MTISEKLLQVKEMITQQVVFLDCPYFKENYKMITIGLSTQKALDADSRTVQPINLIENLDRAGDTTMFFITEEAKETFMDFSQETVKIL